MAGRLPLVRVSGRQRQMPSGDAVPVAAGGTGSTTARQARTNLGLATDAVDAVPVANGGTGATSARQARTNLGLATDVLDAVPISKGGTGAIDKASAIASLGALSANGSNSSSGLNLYSTVVPPFPNVNESNTVRSSSLTVSNGGNTAASACMAFIREGQYGVMVGLDSGNGNNFCIGGWSMGTVSYKFYHEGNTTRSSSGVLSAASPIVRIVQVEKSERRDLLESSFEAAGEYGACNFEARGVLVERLGVGVYRITGSLGLAKEGWRIQDPCSPDGGRTLGITQSQEDEQGVVIVKLFKQRWTLDDDGELHLSAGAPMDVPANSWIDVRLEMPVPEIIVPEMPLEVLEATPDQTQVNTSQESAASEILTS